MVVKKGLPEWGEFVIARTERVTPFAAYVTLLEYPDVAEGMIHVSEVSGKWVRDIRVFVKVGRMVVLKVVKVDYQKNFVNLSLKRVSKYDEKQKINEYRQEERGEKLLERAAKELGKTTQQAYDEVGYLLQEKFGNIYSAFEESGTDKEILKKNGVPENWAATIEKISGKIFLEKSFTIKADLEIKSYAKDGIERIKQILDNFSKKTGASVKYISAPKYRIEISGKDPKTMEKKIINSLEAIVKSAKEFDGEATYKLIK
jgi:translation initiation factor 2 subunit 1